MEKEKKEINVLIAFFISHKSDVKIFLKWILNLYCILTWPIYKFGKIKWQNANEYS